MLNLSDDQRSLLLRHRALSVDADGDEILAGLTVAESRFFLSYGRDQPTESLSGEMALFYQLQRKHLAARAEALADLTQSAG